MIKKLMLALVAILAVATVVWAGEAVYYEGAYWTAFDDHNVLFADDGASASSAHAIYHDTRYGVYVKCSSVTGTLGLAYQLSPTTTTTDFAYPAGVSWVVDSISSTTALFVNFEPETNQKYIRFMLWPLRSDCDATCDVLLYAQ